MKPIRTFEDALAAGRFVLDERPMIDQFADHMAPDDGSPLAPLDAEQQRALDAALAAAGIAERPLGQR